MHFVDALIFICYAQSSNKNITYTYAQYWNLIPLYGRQYKRKTLIRCESTTSVHEETLWTKKLLIFRTTLEVKSSKLGTTKDTLRSDSDLSNCFWSHSAEMPRIFPIKRVQYYTWPSVQAHEAAMSWLSETFLY